MGKAQPVRLLNRYRLRNPTLFSVKWPTEFRGRIAARQCLRYDWSMNFSETIFLFFIALLVFGPKKLPEIARQVGKALNEFKKASNEFKAQIEAEISQLELQELKSKEFNFEEKKISPQVHDTPETEQKALPPAEPPAGAVESSRFSGQAASSADPDIPSHYIDSTAHNA
jgi:TatA/E family protein of Tat protein translocase